MSSIEVLARNFNTLAKRGDRLMAGRAGARGADGTCTMTSHDRRRTVTAIAPPNWVAGEAIAIRDVNDNRWKIIPSDQGALQDDKVDLLEKHRPNKKKLGLPVSFLLLHETEDGMHELLLLKGPVTLKSNGELPVEKATSLKIMDAAYSRNSYLACYLSGGKFIVAAPTNLQGYPTLNPDLYTFYIGTVNNFTEHQVGLSEASSYASGGIETTNLDSSLRHTWGQMRVEDYGDNRDNYWQVMSFDESGIVRVSPDDNPHQYFVTPDTKLDPAELNPEASRSSGFFYYLGNVQRSQTLFHVKVSGRDSDDRFFSEFHERHYDGSGYHELTFASQAAQDAFENYWYYSWDENTILTLGPEPEPENPDEENPEPDKPAQLVISQMLLVAGELKLEKSKKIPAYIVPEGYTLLDAGPERVP